MREMKSSSIEMKVESPPTYVKPKVSLDETVAPTWEIKRVDNRLDASPSSSSSSISSPDDIPEYPNHVVVGREVSLYEGKEAIETNDVVIDATKDRNVERRRRWNERLEEGKSRRYGGETSRAPTTMTTEAGISQFSLIRLRLDGDAKRTSLEKMEEGNATTTTTESFPDSSSTTSSTGSSSSSSSSTRSLLTPPSFSRRLEAGNILHVVNDRVVFAQSPPKWSPQTFGSPTIGAVSSLGAESENDQKPTNKRRKRRLNNPSRPHVRQVCAEKSHWARLLWSEDVWGRTLKVAQHLHIDGVPVFQYFYQTRCKREHHLKNPASNPWDRYSHPKTAPSTVEKRRAERLSNAIPQRWNNRADTTVGDCLGIDTRRWTSTCVEKFAWVYAKVIFDDGKLDWTLVKIPTSCSCALFSTSIWGIY